MATLCGLTAVNRHTSKLACRARRSRLIQEPHEDREVLNVVWHVLRVGRVGSGVVRKENRLVFRHQIAYARRRRRHSTEAALVRKEFNDPAPRNQRYSSKARQMRSTVRCEIPRAAARRRLLQRAASGGFSCSVFASTACTRASLIERGAPERG